MQAPASLIASRVRPDENFPVASWLCPPRLRPAIAAIYWFARTADDLADEGSCSAEERLAQLDAYEADLVACVAAAPCSARWRHVFEPLGSVLRAFALPQAPLSDLLSAFRQDVQKTRAGAGYADRAELLDYCSRSANPVGRLLLHLYAVSEPLALARSDCICTALQLTNFWQDLGVDLPRGRSYLPARDCLVHGVDPRLPPGWSAQPEARRLVAAEVQWTRAMMQRGAPLVRQVPGRAAWELRLVVQGGLRILDQIAAGGFDTVRIRPRLRGWDAVPMVWQALQM